MNRNWIEATEKFVEAEKAAWIRKQKEIKRTRIMKNCFLKNSRYRRNQIRYLTSQLENFMQSMGPTAMKLLIASNSQLIIANKVSTSRGEMHTSYIIDGNGFQKLIETNNSWLVGHPSFWPPVFLQPPALSPISLREAALAFYLYKEAEDPVRWLLDQLDYIASVAQFKK